MKKREVYIELDIIELVVILIFSMAINLIWLIPIIIELQGYSVLLTIVLYGLLTIVLGSYLEKRHKKKIKQRIDKSTINHIKDFFDYIESDRQFYNDVLQKEIKLYNFEREEIGKGSVYTQIARKRDRFLENI